MINKIKERLSFLKRIELTKFSAFASSYCYNLPEEIQIELTTRCNLNCPWCGRKQTKDKSAVIDKIKLKEFIKTLKGIKKVRFVGGGEPLLYPDLVEIIRFGKRYIPNVSLTTNGVLLDKKIISELVESGLSDIAVSLDGTDKKTCYKTKGTDLNQIVKNVKTLRQISNLPIEIWAVVSKENLESLKSIPELAKSLGASYIQFDHMDEIVSSNPFHKIEYNSPELREFVAIVADKCKNLNIKSNAEHLLIPKNNLFNSKICMIPFFYPFIDVNGDLTVCCINHQKLVNVFGKSFKEIWNSKETCNLRKKIIQGKYPGFCKEICGYGINKN